MTKNTDAKERLIDEILKDYDGNPETLVGDGGLLRQLGGRLIEHALEAEMDTHLGYQKHDPTGRDGKNSRNGKTRKTLQTKDSTLEIEVPRDRDGSFTPQIVKKRQTRLRGFDENIISLYARGLSTREIKDEVKSLYGADISAQLISNVTASVLEEVRGTEPGGRRRTGRP